METSLTWVRSGGHRGKQPGAAGEESKLARGPHYNNVLTAAVMEPWQRVRPYITQKSKENIQAYPLVMLQINWEMRTNTAADDKQPHEKKAAKLKEKYGKDTAAYRAKGKPDAAKKGVVKAEKSKKKEEEEEDKEDEEDEEEREDEEDEDEEDDNE
ncbi:High mobility group protein B2 [Tupaia chinensis]|uniref:High mobility group protein B2 n=1 Tax=Tupaia chinensis TaxID=246437 RepID=L9JL06_TUPCH|nr:High mobility group protein B2 [Tupaia chinensis]